MSEIVEEIRQTWMAERPRHEAFCEFLKSEFARVCTQMGIRARVTGRVKEIDSLVRKALKQVREGRTPSLPKMIDKVGLRIIVRFQHDVDAIVADVRNRFDCLKVDYKTEGVRVNEFGYRSCHIDLQLGTNHPGQQNFAGFAAELQVRTLAQDLWAEMAHELSYKSVLRDTSPEFQLAIDRRIYILSALIESADMDFSRINDDVTNAPGAEPLSILRSLEHEYYQFTSNPYDLELSLDVIRLFREGDTRNPHQFATEISKFTADHREKLDHIFSDQATNQNRSMFLFQPESFLIFEALQRRPLSVEDIWEQQFPIQELRRLQVVWGVATF